MQNIGIYSQKKPDTLGVIASSLCLIHCLATPLLFIAQAGAAGHHAESPFWWSLIDTVLLVVSGVAVYRAVKNTAKTWMKTALTSSWALLAMIILNEKLEVMHLAEEWIYLPTIFLIFLHLYNAKYCRCKEETCCAGGNQS